MVKENGQERVIKSENREVAIKTSSARDEE